MKFRKSGPKKNLLSDRNSGADANNMRLIHVTSVGASRQILDDGQFTVARCPIFGRDLNYFFLLRPAYKLKGAEEKQSLIDFFPVVFVLRTDKLSKVFHAYPFDTGGAHNGAFESANSPWIFLDDFELANGLQGAADHMIWAFENRKSYFDGNLKMDTFANIPDWDSGPHAFAQIAMLAQFGHNQPDLRASSIEIAYNFNIPLNGNVEFIVLPKQFLEDPRGKNLIVIDQLKKYNIKFSMYDWQPNQRVSDFHEKIQQIVRKHLNARGCI